MVEAQLVEDRGVDVVDMHGVLNRSESELVGLAVDCTRFETSACEPHRKCIDMVVPAGRFAYLAHGRSAEFAAPNHNRTVQESTLLQVSHQRRAGAVDVSALFGKCFSRFSVGPP